MGAKKEAKITVGNVVRVIKAMREGEKQYIGRLGMVMSVIGDVTLDRFFELTAHRRFKVHIDSDFIWLDEDQVQLLTKEKQKVSEQPQISPKRRIVIEITDNGADAKYIVGKNIEKTSSVKRHSDDKPDDRLAAHYVVGKLFGQKVTKDNVDMDALKKAKCDCMIARYHLDEISKVLDPFGEPDFGKVDFKF